MSAYIYAKRKGKRWLGVARWEPADGADGTCISLAEHAFSKAGYPNLAHTCKVSVDWECKITKQQNYIPPVKIVDISYITLADAQAHANAERYERHRETRDHSLA